MELELTGMRALVVGGTSGIGKATARELAREGVAVAIAGRNEAALAEAAAELVAETGGTIVPFTCETSSDDSVRAMVAAAVDRLGGVDILVNCAAQPAATRPPKIAEIDDEVFWSDVNVKVVGYLRCIREVVPHMAAAGGGTVVNVSGYAARETGSTVGSIRNASVVALTKNLADELAPQGIRVIVVHPAGTRTERTRATISRVAEQRAITEAEAERQLGASSLLGRYVDAREIAYVIAFLVSPKAIAINGDAIGVAGGRPGTISY